VLAGPVHADRGELGRVVLFVLVDEDLEDVGVGEELGQHDPLGRLVGADLVDGGPAGHAEGDDDGAALFSMSFLQATPRSLNPGTVRRIGFRSGRRSPGHCLSSSTASAPMS
jgi:hypothetical protein